MKQYKAPDFEVALFEVDEMIALQGSQIEIGPGDPDPDPGDWY